eukprot:CAMPEP_0204821268 /NCGR_PEP_ID=MMETSP1018-20131115/6569_1 /ASSEMBLY_ACC=CAM_ASM_000518 /TAXON_ID=46462 /ORGANISM="Anophryoides haemophila, Strain AH6" /LENGTH=78 /DNA_ID=CAMNT_0051925211 /DNA_START=630 /DNA_END=866 /DNA_ORIENTATION=+
MNNNAHDSVGAQPTCADKIDFPGIAKACGYKNTFVAHNEEELLASLTEMNQLDGPTLLEIKIKPGARSNLGRPKSGPI